MKKLRVLSIALASSFLLTSCGENNYVSDSAPENMVEKNDATIDASGEYTELTEFEITIHNNVLEVVISPHESEEMTFKYTNPQKIDAIVAYISDFDVLQKSQVSDPSKYYGSTSPMDYKISLYSEDGTVTDYYHFNN